MKQKPVPSHRVCIPVLSWASQNLTEGATGLKAARAKAAAPEDGKAHPPHQPWRGTGHGKAKPDKSVPIKGRERAYSWSGQEPQLPRSRGPAAQRGVIRASPIKGGVFALEAGAVPAVAMAP